MKQILAKAAPGTAPEIQPQRFPDAQPGFWQAMSKHSIGLKRETTRRAHGRNALFPGDRLCSITSASRIGVGDATLTTWVVRCQPQGPARLKHHTDGGELAWGPAKTAHARFSLSFQTARCSSDVLLSLLAFCFPCATFSVMTLDAAINKPARR